MTTQSRLRLLVLALFLCLYIFPLGIRPLMVPDETRYAEVPREMIASGDWITPRLNGLRYFEKPPLGYWLNGLAILACGENEFAVRLPSALSVGLSALMILLLVPRFCPKEEVWAGPVAALIYLTAVEVAAVGTFNVLDSMLAAALTLTMVSFFLASQAAAGCRPRFGWLVAAGLGCGLAFLIKGFLALVVPALAIGAYLAWEGRWRDILALAWLPLLVATLTALPWGLAIHSREPDFWRYFFWVEHVQRFMGGDKAQHRESFWAFVLTAPSMFIPWAFLLPAAVLGLRPGAKRIASPALTRFSLAWFALPFLFFSISSGKLLTYILPCFPPLAILTSLGLLAQLRAARSKAFTLGAGAMALLFALLALALLMIQTVGLEGVTPPYGTPWQGGLAVAALLAMALLPLAAAAARTEGRKLILFGIGPALFLGVAAWIMPDQLIEKKSPGNLLLRHHAEITAHTLVLSDEEPVLAVCWFLKRNDVVLVNGAGELSYGVRHAEEQGRHLDLAQARERILENPGNVVLVVRARKYRRWSAQLPTPTTIDASGPDGYILARY